MIDASVLIAQLEATDASHDRAARLLVRLAEEPRGASPVTLAEVLVGPARTGRLDRAHAALAMLEVSSVALEEDAATKLALLRVATGLKLPDCCVLLAADQTHGAVATFDTRLAAAASQRGHAVHST